MILNDRRRGRGEGVGMQRKRVGFAVVFFWWVLEQWKLVQVFLVAR